MKKPILVGCIAFAICYLLGCFWGANFNIKEWPESLRLTIGFIGFCFFILGAAYVHINDTTR